MLGWADFFVKGGEIVQNTMVRTSLAGQTFGRWNVQDAYIKTAKGERKWLCRCDCGTERYVLERALKSGASTSCGCLRKERSAQALSRDLTGRTFGELTVLRKLEKKDKKGIWWLCRCSCGAECRVLGTLLITGRKTHCSGAGHKKNYAFVDITGQKFGRLTAEYPTDRRDPKGYVIWHCRCDCGNEIEADYNSLLYSNLKSCGCKKKEHDQNLRTYLTHIDGTSLDMLKSKKLPSDNTTGYRGVYFIKGKYTAKIVFQKKAYYLGSYDNIEDAAQARKKAEELLFDGFAAYYDRWKAIADKDPLWAEEHPVQIRVSKDGLSGLELELTPKLA